VQIQKSLVTISLDEFTILKKKCAHTVRRFNIQNEVKCIIVIWHLATEATEIEVILDVLIINLTKEFIASQATEPGNPRCVLSIRCTHIRLLGICVRFL
jgi:hypothetical protein